MHLESGALFIFLTDYKPEHNQVTTRTQPKKHSDNRRYEPTHNQDATNPQPSYNHNTLTFYILKS